MSSPFVRIVTLLAGILIVFAAVAVVLLRIIPEPHQETDYLVAGTVATFAALLILFLILLKTWVKSPDVFFKRRKK